MLRICDPATRRLKSRLHKRNLPPQVKIASQDYLPVRVGEAMPKAYGGLCLCSRDFNRRVLCRVSSNSCSLDRKRECERTALAGMTVDRDCPLMQIDTGFYHGQAESSPSDRTNVLTPIEGFI